MIFGRRNHSQDEADQAEDSFEEPDALEDEFFDKDSDPREYGPFDFDEVELGGDNVERVSYGSLIITPLQGLTIEPLLDPATNSISSLAVLWENSAMELALFAAPTTLGLAEELSEDIEEEAEQAGGSCQERNGPFGPELRRVLPLEGPEGEQLFHVSRIWLVDGPRWLLRATLMGAAAMVEDGDPVVEVFVEFFRNVVVRRDETPRVPGQIITLGQPEPLE